ncbi:phage tail protein [Enterobacter wuhouensis]|uniref:phage tail protein n=1 Tax=Enterobacter wuhouensis TaxID=2529381 RepID=UPI002FD29C68
MASRQTFTWLPTFESEKTLKSAVTVVQFGDGYEHRQANGLNWRKESWSLTFKTTHQVGNAIDDFLTEHGALTSFNWVNPRGKSLVVVNDGEHKVKRNPGYLEITCIFRQVFE